MTDRSILQRRLAALALTGVLFGSLAQPAVAFIRGGAWGGASAGHWGAADNGHWAAGADGHADSGSYGTASSGEHYATGAHGATATAQNGSWAASANGHSDSGSYGTTANGTHYATGNNGAVAANDGHYAASGPNGYAYGSHYTTGGGSWNAVHPPTVVNQYNTGCSNCGGWSGGGAAVAAGVTGLAVGATIGAATAAAAAPHVAYAAPAPYALGDVYAALPAGCGYNPYNGVAFYNCGGTWFSPYYGANGMYYRVVPVP